jgi:uncharacterized membrane protein YphA (DoxX/SURF4 family)
MLNLFPIQFLAPVAYLLLRVCLGFVLIRLGRSHLRNRESLKEVFTFTLFPYGLFFTWYVALFEIVLGLMFIFGFLTQLAALFTILYALKFLIMRKRFIHPSIPTPLVYVFIFITALSLLITGAGIFAFDLPI